MEIMAIFLCISCYGFAKVMMDNVCQYVTQLFGHIMSPKSLNMAYCTYGLNQFWHTLPTALASLQKWQNVQSALLLQSTRFMAFYTHIQWDITSEPFNLSSWNFGKN